MPRRSFTLRLPQELAHKLTTVASVLNQTQATVIRDCLDTGLDGLVEGEAFQSALRSRIDAQHQLLSYAPEASEVPSGIAVAAVE